MLKFTKSFLVMAVNGVLCLMLLGSNVGAHQLSNVKSLNNKFFAGVVVSELEALIGKDLNTEYNSEKGWNVFYNNLINEVHVTDRLVEAQLLVDAQNNATAITIVEAQELAQRPQVDDYLLADGLALTVNTAAASMITVVEARLGADLLCVYELVQVGQATAWIDPIKMIGSIIP